MRTAPAAGRLERKKASLKTRDFGLELKAVNDDGTFSGYGSVFGNVDSDGEIVASGAFSDSLAEIDRKGRPVPVLWQHRSDQPIGVYSSLREDRTGLYVEGTLLKDAVRQAAESYALLKAGAVSGLSIGYYVRQSSYDEHTGIRTLQKLDLTEISLVTFPANDEARIDAVKSARIDEFARRLREGAPMPIREFEDILREAGVPKAMATQIASVGYAKAIRGEPEGKANDQAAFFQALSRLGNG